MKVHLIFTSDLLKLCVSSLPQTNIEINVSIQRHLLHISNDAFARCYVQILPSYWRLVAKPYISFIGVCVCVCAVAWFLLVLICV